MKVIVHYKNDESGDCIGAYVVPDSLALVDVASILNSNAVAELPIQDGLIPLSTGTIGLSVFLAYFSNFYINHDIELVQKVGTNLIDKRKIDPAGYDHSVPLAFSRANTTVNLGVL